MKKFIILIAAIVLFSLHSMAQTPNWAWAKSAGNAGADYATSVTSDATGNVYVTGYFYSTTITFGSTVLTNADVSGSTSDIYLVKYDANGTVIWAKSAGGTGNDLAASVTTDAAGNVYVGGWYKSTSIYGMANTNTNQDMFLAKYSSGGAVLWTKRAGSTANDAAMSIHTDAAGNVFVAGYFQGLGITFGSYNLTNTVANAFATFFVKYDGSGNVVWATCPTGRNYSEATAVTVDAAGNAYQTG